MLRRSLKSCPENDRDSLRVEMDMGCEDDDIAYCD